MTMGEVGQPGGQAPGAQTPRDGARLWSNVLESDQLVEQSVSDVRAVYLVVDAAGTEKYELTVQLIDPAGWFPTEYSQCSSAA